MQRKFAVTSAIKIYSKMWELCMHPDYDDFIPLTFKLGKFQLKTNIFLGNSNSFLLSLTVVWIENSENKTSIFSSLRSCSHRPAIERNLYWH